MTTTRATVRRSWGLALVIWTLGACSGTGQAAATLRWKFQPGEVLRYESNQTTVTKVKEPNGQEVGQTLTLTLDLSWKVNAVDPAGVANLTQTIDRIRTSATMPFGKFSFDSKESGDAGGPAGPLFKMLVGAEFTFKMNPKGELSDIALSEKLLGTLQGDREPAGAQGQFSEAGLKNMIAQMGLILPENEVNAGQTWARKLAIPAGPNGETRSIDQTYTYTGAEAGGKGLEAVDMTTRFDPVAPDPKVPVTIKSQEATGHYAFNTVGGRIETSRMVEKVDLTGQIQGKEIAQTNETITVLTLQHDKTP